VVHRVIWSPAAIEDVEAIAAFIARDSPRYAAAMVRKILSSTRQLREFPNSGPAAPEFEDPQIRHLVVTQYRVLYRVDGGVVTIATVVHTSQSFDSDVGRISGHRA